MVRATLAAVAMIAVCSTAVAETRSDGLAVREVTVFKDGHALVLREGETALDASGDATLSDLPRPVMGTFWAESTTQGARLASVSVERVEVQGTREAASLEDLLIANVGRAVYYRTLADTELRRGTLTDVLPGSPGGSGVYDVRGHYTPPQPARDAIAIISSAEGHELVQVSRLTDVRVWSPGPDGGVETSLKTTTTEERMTLDLAWDETPGDVAGVSLMYLQRGLRWIPSYRVTMLSDDRVRLELQATLVNELVDLDGVTLHLAVGVPSFAFDHTPDPMALRESMDQLGLFFQQANGAQTGAMLSNALMAQTARMSESRIGGRDAHVAQGQSGQASPEFSGAERAEDLFVFTVDGVTLRKGARLVLPVASYECDASSVYTLDLPAAPPTQAHQHFNTQQQRDIAALLDRPVARHVLRIEHENDKGYPITTAPALVVRDGVTLAQGLITYTPSGASVDLEVGSAVDIAVEVNERETGRTPSDLRWRNDDYVRIDAALGADLTNRKPHPVRLEVRRLVFGSPVEASHDAEQVRLSVFEAERQWSAAQTVWWRWYGWPWYWHALNGATEFRWDVELDAGEELTLEASWYYHWR